MDAVRASETLFSFSDEAIALGKNLVEDLPEQAHHVASWCHNTLWTPIFEQITKKYGNLNDLWNKIKLPHRGRHPTRYHQWINDALTEIDSIAKGDKDLFFELYEKYVKNVLDENPWVLKKDWWENYGDEFLEQWDNFLEEGLE